MARKTLTKNQREERALETIIACCLRGYGDDFWQKVFKKMDEMDAAGKAVTVAAPKTLQQEKIALQRVGSRTKAAREHRCPSCARGKHKHGRGGKCWSFDNTNMTYCRCSWRPRHSATASNSPTASESEFSKQQKG